MEKILEKIENEKEFLSIIRDITTNEKVQQMKNFRQHYTTSCYEHCLIASYYCYLICKKYHLDYISAARAAMIHDLFLYDWRIKNGRTGFHAFTHPKTAFENANRLFHLNLIEKDMVLKHMWPVTFKLPKYKESFILTFVDKYCAMQESFFAISQQLVQKKAFRYAYVFLSLLIIRL